MQKKYLIGIDVGTQSAKVVIFDLDGQIVCSASHPLRPMNIPAPLRAEHADDDIWESLKTALKKAMEAFNSDPTHDTNSIAAIGLCAIRCCRVLLQKSGELSYPVISWMDERLNRPFEYKSEYGEVKYVTTTSGYLTHRLTGEFKDTCANYIGCWPMNNHTGQWSDDDEIVRKHGLSRDMLFDVIKPGDILGYITAKAAQSTHLPEGIPVVATAHDKAVEALGSGALHEGTALISLGTYICAMLNGKHNNESAKNFWPFQAAIPGKFLYECMGVRRGMWTVDWFCRQYQPGVNSLAKEAGLTIEDWFNKEAEAVPAGSEGLITIHDWAPPAEHLYRKGVMLGFDGRHGRGHMYRSLLEGIMFTQKNHFDTMTEELGIDLKKIIISGGGAKSEVFLQIFADGFGVPVHRNEMTDAAAIGSAICAGVAAKVFPDFESAAKKMVKLRDIYHPKTENHRLYKKINKEVYSAANDSLDPLLKALSCITDQ